MANRDLFKSATVSKSAKKVTPNAVNAAGGAAFSRTSEQELAQLAATAIFNQTFYASPKDQLDNIKKLAFEVSVEFLTDVAIYSRTSNYLKDAPALLLAILLVRDNTPEKVYFKRAAPFVLDNAKMVRNFVQILRSGVAGRKSLGTAAKKAIQAWFAASNDHYLLGATVNNQAGQPSLADVIRLVHPAPNSKSRAALYAYLTDSNKKLVFEDLPNIVKEWEAFKVSKGTDRVMPNLPFEMLSSMNLSDEEWGTIARNAKWQMTRMNLQTFKRHNVFKNAELTKLIADRLKNEDLVKKARQFPYQIFTSYKMVENDNDIPTSVKNALNKACDAALRNVPSFKGRTALLVDCSGSMTSKFQSHAFMEVAALFAAALLKANEDAIVYLFDTTAVRVNINPMDSVFTIAKQLLSKAQGGGTDISCGINKVMQDIPRNLPENLVIISDNESWYTSLALSNPQSKSVYGYYANRGDNSATAWRAYKTRQKNAKLALIDLSPTITTQVQSDKSVLNVGGFSDEVFNVLGGFFEQNENPDYWISHIKKTAAEKLANKSS